MRILRRSAPLLPLLLLTAACSGEPNDNPPADITTDTGHLPDADDTSDAGDLPDADDTPDTDNLPDTEDPDTPNDPDAGEAALNITVSGQGRVTSEPALIDCPATCQATLAPSTTLALSAQPDPGHTFEGWSGDCAGTQREVTLIVTGSISCTASFAPEDVTPPAGAWFGHYGQFGTHEFKAFAPTDDGGVVVVGRSDVYGSGGDEAIAARLDARGDVVWQQSLGSSGDDVFHDVIATTDGDFLAVGTTEDDDEIGAAWAVRFAPDGALRWERAYQLKDDTSPSYASGWTVGYAVDRLPGGDYIIAAHAGLLQDGSGISTGLITINYAGEVERVRAIGHRYLSPANDIATNSAGDMVVVGEDYYSYAPIAVRLTASGSVVWTLADTPFAAGSAELHGAVLGNDGSTYLAGVLEPSRHSSATDAWVLKVGADGTILWQRTFDASTMDEGYAVSLLDNGDVLFSGITGFVDTSEVVSWALPLNPNNGMPRSEHTFRIPDGGAVLFNRVEAVSGGGIFGVGQVRNPSAHNNLRGGVLMAPSISELDTCGGEPAIGLNMGSSQHDDSLTTGSTNVPDHITLNISSSIDTTIDLGAGAYCGG
ncbi:hypothetical protein FRC98_09710 [Lujinxingia vulgaris]|uniref:Bacterial repeat domain-containing protein n=1 Tax=Lujinxingia vulgaris TaxID=2600176 RepID=A0A5C6XBA7_9DELT|nr:hypothetical protein [Lujinxingia vulgaris]TXD37007.1 hypothetical protein FRC98_09710 [Lujinxingia vulgaris]